MSTPHPDRRHEQRAQTRSDLLAAAAWHFAEHGYHATSIDRIAEAAGYTKGAVYSNFDSKEELFLELLNRRIEFRIAVLERLLFTRSGENGGESLADGLPDMEAVHLDWLLETELLLYAARNEQVRDLVATHRRSMYDRLADAARRHLADLGVSADRLDPDHFARILATLAAGLAGASLADPVDTHRMAGLMAEVCDALIRQAQHPEA